MKLKLIFFSIFICSLGLYGQSENEEDTNYLEDQFYVSLSYDLLINKPETITQNGFSGGFSMDRTVSPRTGICSGIQSHR